MTEQEIRSKIRLRLNDLRGVDRLINLPLFSAAFKCATKEQINMILASVEANHPEDLRKLLKSILKFDALSLRDLRELAADYKIKGYSTMTKDMLLIFVKAKEKESL